MSSILGTYARRNISFKEGKGCYLFSDNGEKYLDFVQGIAVNVLGHCHEHLVKTIKEQSSRLWHGANVFVIPEQEKLAKKLTENTFADFVCFQNSGSEATEASIKIARKYYETEASGTSCFPISNNYGRLDLTECRKSLIQIFILRRIRQVTNLNPQHLLLKLITSVI